MSNLVNLKQFKKRAARDDAAKTAETNRALFGRTKSEKKRDELTSAKAANALDQHRIDGETSK